MSDIDDLLCKHYAARVLNKGSEQEVIQQIKTACEDKEFLEKAKTRLELLDNYHNTFGSIAERDFCGHINRIGLQMALDVPVTEN